MKKMSFYLLLTLTCLQTYAQTPEAVVASFFEALNSKSHKLLNELCLEDIQLHSLSIGKEAKFSSESRQDFIEGIKSIPEDTKIFEDILSQESIINEHFAQFSLPYIFYVNGEFSHQGTNVITLIKINEDWKISYIADTRYRP